MSDPLTFTWESTPALWRCYYDPEGPNGFGKTRETALTELLWICDGESHREELLIGAIVAAIPEPPARSGG